MTYYQKLEQHTKKLSRIHHLSAICSWDQAAKMPEGGNTARSEAMAELALIHHELSTAAHLAEWFEKAEAESLSAEQKISLKEMKRQWKKDNVLPAELVEQKSLTGSKCEHAWRSQRKENNWHEFSQNLEKVVQLAREEAQIRADATGLSRYNAMLDLYEPGMTCEKIDEIFGQVKTWLPSLIQEVQAQQSHDEVLTPKGPFPAEQQKTLSLDIMSKLGFDFSHGRLDVSTHPFCGGVPTDVRITTRYDEDDFTSALMGVIHETGHARYEQGLPEQWLDFPVGQARSMGIHESQSLFFEMQLSRSKPFIEILAPLAREVFSRNNDKSLSTENMVLFSTRVKPGYIRVDADEVTYPAHIILRYEIERDLIEGKIEVADIPELWDKKMTEYLGLSTKGNFTDGCMQDIHWTDGSFGYFPSYTLGAMYAAQFMAAMRREMNVDNLIRERNLQPIFNWLDRHIWKKASFLSTEDILREATGETLNPDYFKEHLVNRYLES
ncbi:carboxypeptidase M32 [Photobacterium galatheae]|uniref:Metal-dependent carboxypeptidase n=1 Tax=Photobacterium galatheae TaxID=1654360 RepID=A0A066RVN8_9GAMM|nr:carboxypeptidase M32 [Photobacterium galatheae]KDM91453.1 peptidase M32 [Photobacterium galatheae]MCM0149525.1 carboxypeptidase M32 [Photobacterium galatheae]